MPCTFQSEEEELSGDEGIKEMLAPAAKQQDSRDDPVKVISRALASPWGPRNESHDSLN